MRQTMAQLLQHWPVGAIDPVAGGALFVGSGDAVGAATSGREWGREATFGRLDIPSSRSGYGTVATPLPNGLRAAVALIPGVDEGSISVVTPAARHLPEPVQRAARPGDALQAELGQRPCFDAGA